MLVFLYFIFFIFFLICRSLEEYSREDRLASIEAKLDFLIHHLDPKTYNDSLME